MTLASLTFDGVATGDPGCSGARAAECPVGPAGLTPGGGVQGVAAVDDDAVGDDGAELGGVDLAVDLPLGQVQDDVGVAAGVLDVVGVGQVGVDRAGHGQGLGVVHGDGGAGVVGGPGDVQGGGVADVVAVGLERGAEDGDALADQGAAALGAGEVDHP